MALHRAMTPAICECCGRDIPATVERYGLRVETAPPRASYKGAVIPRLTRAQIAMLYRLCEFGRASFESLTWRDEADPTNNDAVRVQMTHVRRAFREAGVMVHVAAVDGWGYVLTEFTEAEKAAAPARDIRVRGPDARRLCATLNASEAARP